MAVDSYSTSLLVASALMITVSTLSISVRLWVRIRILRGLGWDDALITTSWVFALALYTATLTARNYGFGQHEDVVPSENLTNFSKLIMVCSTTFSWGVAAAKASFAVLYLRILQGRRLSFLNRFLCAFLLCQAMEETLVVVLQCRPVARAWDTSIDGSCIKLVPMWWCTFIFNLFTDLTLFIQPIPSMWRLQLPLTKRIAVIAMLSLGLLVCVISVIRIIFVTKIGTDVTYAMAEPMIWSQVEITALITCSCIPSLRQIVQQIPWLNRLVGLSSNKDSDHQYYGRSGSKTMGGTASKSGHYSNGASIALQSRNHHGDPFGPTRSRTHRNDFGMVSHAHAERGAGANVIDGGIDATRPPSQDGSTDEIFPYRATQGGDKGANGLAHTGGAGAILVTRDINIKHDIEEISTTASQSRMYSDDDIDDDINSGHGSGGRRNESSSESDVPGRKKSRNHAGK